MKNVHSMMKLALIAVATPLVLAIILKQFLVINTTWSLPEWGWVRAPVIATGTDFERGDYLEFTPPIKSPWKSVKIVKGIAGDVITIANRFVLLNDEIIFYAKPHARDGRPLTIIAEQTIPPDYYFLIGTHRDSYDSRYAEIGLIHKDKISARVWPLPNIAWLGLDGPLLRSPDEESPA